MAVRKADGLSLFAFFFAVAGVCFAVLGDALKDGTFEAFPY